MEDSGFYWWIIDMNDQIIKIECRGSNTANGNNLYFPVNPDNLDYNVSISETIDQTYIIDVPVGIKSVNMAFYMADDGSGDRAYIRRLNIKTKNSVPYITNGLVFYVDAGNPSSWSGSGTVLNDLSGNGYDVTMDVTFVPTYSVLGGGSFYFTGGANFETQAANIVLTDSITMISWYYQTGSGSGSPRILEMIESGTTSGSASNCLAVDPDGSHRAWVDISGTTNSRIAQTNDATARPLNTWGMIAYTFDGSNGRLYYNGVLTDTIAGSNNNIDDINTITIGAIPDVGFLHSNHSFTGNIAITQVYNRTLSASEIMDTFNAGKSRFGL